MKADLFFNTADLSSSCCQAALLLQLLSVCNALLVSCSAAQHIQHEFPEAVPRCHSIFCIVIFFMLVVSVVSLLITDKKVNTITLSQDLLTDLQFGVHNLSCLVCMQTWFREVLVLFIWYKGVTFPIQCTFLSNFLIVLFPRGYSHSGSSYNTHIEINKNSVYYVTK